MQFFLGQLNEKRDELIDHTVTDNLRLYNYLGLIIED